MLAGCAGPKAYVRPGFLEHPPTRVAVLPFVITYPYDLKAGEAIPASHVIGRDTFRKTFYYAFAPYGYEDMKLAEVDQKLSDAFGPVDEGKWREATAQTLGRTLGVDAVIYGEISRIVHLSTPLYTETSLRGSLRMVETSSGNALWRQPVSAAERGGALMKKGQVVDFLKDQARSFHPEVKFLRVADAAARQALKGMPNPAMSAHEVTASAAASGRARLAILPFEAKRQPWQPAADALRQDMAASLQESDFDVLELQGIDAALKDHGWMPGQSVTVDAAGALGADVLLRGTVTDWGRSYAVVESWVKAELQLEVVDAASGTVLWSEKKRNTRQAGLLKGPTGYQSVVVAPLTGMSAGNLQRVETHLAREMAQDVATSAAVRTYLDSHSGSSMAATSAPASESPTAAP